MVIYSNYPTVEWHSQTHVFLLKDDPTDDASDRRRSPAVVELGLLRIRLLGFDHGVNPKEDQGVPLAQSKDRGNSGATSGHALFRSPFAEALCGVV